LSTAFSTSAVIGQETRYFRREPIRKGIAEQGAVCELADANEILRLSAYVGAMKKMNDSVSSGCLTHRDSWEGNATILASAPRNSQQGRILFLVICALSSVSFNGLRLIAARLPVI
jgi:hypothetical protein